MSVSLNHVEYASLRRERDPELRAEGLLSFAARQAQRSHSDIAASIYAELIEGTETPASLRERAQTRFDALRGTGEIGARAEVLLNRFVQEAAEPTTLLAMTAAGAAFRATRFLMLTRLASNPSASLLTRGIGARAVAGLAGFGVEATVFPLAGRMGNLALGREQEWSRQALGRELASSFLMLGALKAGGLLTGSLVRGTSLLRPLVQQAGMFGGILLGHEMEVRAGMRPRQSVTMTMIDSLSTLLQFNVAGRLNQGLLGEGMQSWERGLEVRSEALSLPRLRLPQLPQATGLTPALAGTSQASQSTRAPEELLGSDGVFMVQNGDGSPGDGGGNGNGSGKRTPTLTGLSRSPILPASSRPPLFLENAFYRLAGLSLRAREIRPLSKGPDIQSRVLVAVEEYLRQEKDSVVVVYPDGESMDLRQQGFLRVDFHRLHREFKLPPEFTLTVVVPAADCAYNFSKNTHGSLEMTTLPLVRRALSRDSVTPPRVEIVMPRPTVKTPAVTARPGSAPDLSELRVAFDGLLTRLQNESEQHPSIRVEKGRIGREELAALTEAFSTNPPPAGRRFTLLWVEKGGGQVQFVRDGDAIRADWKAYQATPQTYWYLPLQSGLGHYQLFAAHDFTAYAWQSEPAYGRDMERSLAELWTRLAMPGTYEKAEAREEGAARRGSVLARLAQQWVKSAGEPGKTWHPHTMQHLIQIHQILEVAEAHLDLGLVRRFQERMGRQSLLQYNKTVAGLPPRQDQGRLLPLDELVSNASGVTYIPLDVTVKDAFVRQLFAGLNRPRYPLENNRLLRDPRRMGAIYRETLRGRIIPLLGLFQLVSKGNTARDWTYLLKVEASSLTATETKQRSDLEFLLSEIPEHVRILHLEEGNFHRKFLREIFRADRPMMDAYLLLRSELTKLPPDLKLAYRTTELPSKAELEAEMGRFVR